MNDTVSFVRKEENMPTDTFIHLSEEKKQKIIISARKEFARVPFSETSIKNITEDAGIARRKFLSIL